jgi:hypothetical protein
LVTTTEKKMQGTNLEYVDLDEEIEVDRKSAVLAVALLGGPKLSARATNAQVVAALEERVHPRLNSIGDIDSALTGLCSMTRRIGLMQQRAELSEADRKVTSRDIRQGNLIVYAPNDQVTCISTWSTKRTVNCEIVDGRRAFRLFLYEFRELVFGDEGWARANPELARNL